ncbi:unnamed protein product [Orchesella dallaii]|uniref:Uncharacterized protein n=1 Tax=Orchesella dallaii TaxID=48710 RepID=A0ABP1PXJ4_9HEXA
MEKNENCSNLIRPREGKPERSGRISKREERCHASSNEAVSKEEDYLIPPKKQRLMLNGQSTYTGENSTASGSGIGFSCDVYEYDNKASPFLVPAPPPPKPCLKVSGAEEYCLRLLQPPVIGYEASNMVVRQTAGNTLDMERIDVDKQKLIPLQTSSSSMSPSYEHRSRSTRVKTLIEGVHYERRPRQTQRRRWDEKGSSNK